MIAEQYRVPRVLIPYILKRGNEFASQLFIVRQKENTQPFSRYRVIISTKVAKKAVDRNKLRRMAYEAIRISSKEGKLPTKSQNYDAILIAKKKIIDTDFQALEKDLKNNIINR